MIYEFITNMINSHINPFLQDNLILYLVLSLLYYLLGGIDETLVTLFVVHLIYIMLTLVVKKTVDILHIIKIYIVIMLGNVIDISLDFNTTSLRNYLILYYTYNNIIDMINILAEDERLAIPKNLKDVLKKIKKE